MATYRVFYKKLFMNGVLKDLEVTCTFGNLPLDRAMEIVALLNYEIGTWTYIEILIGDTYVVVPGSVRMEVENVG